MQTFHLPYQPSDEVTKGKHYLPHGRTPATHRLRLIYTVRLSCCSWSVRSVVSLPQETERDHRYLLYRLQTGQAQDQHHVRRRDLCPRVLDNHSQLAPNRLHLFYGLRKPFSRRSIPKTRNTWVKDAPGPSQGELYIPEIRFSVNGESS